MTARGTGWDRWAIAAATGVVLLFMAVSVQKLWSADFWGNLQTGERILERGSLPRVEENSYTAAGKPLVEVRWLYCVVTALGWRVGAWALCVGMAVVLGVMWAVVVWPSRRVLWRPEAMLLLGLGLAAGSARWVHRPELATGLCVALFLVGLDGAGRRGRPAWWLVAVQVVWVNSHSLYFLGPVLAWMFAGSAAVDVARSRRGGWKAAGGQGLLAGAVTGACWINPYFHGGAMYALAIMGEMQNATADFISELRSPLTIPLSVWRWDLWAQAVLVAAVAVTYGLNWRRITLARLGVLVLMVYLGASAQRSAALVAIMGVWAGLTNLAERRDRRPLAFAGAVLRRAALAAAGIGAVGAAWYQASDRAWTEIGVGRETGLGVVDWDLATGAADFVVVNELGDRVFNSMHDGYYLGWRSGGKIKVFINGRTDVFGSDLLLEFASVGPGNWDAVSAKWGIHTAVLQVRGFERLVGSLVEHPGWALVYLDHRNVVFVRNRPEAQAVVAKYRIDPTAAWTARTERPDEVEWWKRAIGGRGRPWHTFGMAQSFLAIGSVGNAERYLERTLERFPNHERAIAELAALYRFAGRTAAGDQVFGRLRAKSEWARYSERTLANRLSDAGRREEAITAMERAVSQGEREPQVLVTLGDWYFGAKNYGTAKTQYEAAVKAGVDTAEEWKKLGYAREQTGDIGGAGQAYERSLDRDANQHEVWYLLGLVQARQGDRAAASRSLERALRIKPDYAGAKRALEGLRR
jgi:Tfp pilus assembly protein PilF